ncbi:MAG: hypothetical protein U1D30_10570 [Planctomycetota bacterium]
MPRSLWTYGLCLLPVIVASKSRADFIGDQVQSGLSVHTTGITSIVFALDDAGSGSANAVVAADIATGNRTVISRPGVVGSGPDFGSLITGLTIDRDGSILLAGFDADAIFKINPLTGDRSILSGPSVGTGPALDGASAILVGPNGEIFVGTGSTDSIIRIDPITGDRTLISGPSVGTGPAIDYVSGLTLTANGDFYALSSNSDRIYFVDGVTGNRTIVSGGGVGSGPAFGPFISDLQILLDGTLAVTDGTRILRVNPVTGNRSILSDATTGSGTIMGWMEWLTLAPNGFLLASGDSSNSSRNYGVFLIDPATGDRVLLTGKDVGIGYYAGQYREAVAIGVAVPEASSLSLAAACALSFWVIHRRRRRFPAK